MTALKACYQALKPLGIAIKPDLQTGSEKEFITYNIAYHHGAEFGDDEPGGCLADVQVHYCCDLSSPYYGTMRKIQKALNAAGFTYPRVTPQDTDTRRHLIFECEYFEED